MGLDPSAFDALYEAHAPRLFSMSRRITGDVAAAEDVVQEAFLKAFTSTDQIAEPAAWLTTVTKNASLNRLRARARLASFDAPLEEGESEIVPEYADPAPLVDPADATLAANEVDFVWSLVDDLGADQRAALSLFAAGASYAEIAQSIGKTITNVGVLISRARGKVASRYADRAYAARRVTGPCGLFRADLLLHVQGKSSTRAYLDHLRACGTCVAIEDDLRGMGRVLAAVPMLALPTTLGPAVWAGVQGALAGKAIAAGAGVSAGTGAAHGVAAATGSAAVGGVGGGNAGGMGILAAVGFGKIALILVPLAIAVGGLAAVAIGSPAPTPTPAPAAVVVRPSASARPVAKSTPPAVPATAPVQVALASPSPSPTPETVATVDCEVLDASIQHDYAASPNPGPTAAPPGISARAFAYYWTGQERILAPAGWDCLIEIAGNRSSRTTLNSTDGSGSSITQSKDTSSGQIQDAACYLSSDLETYYGQAPGYSSIYRTHCPGEPRPAKERVTWVASGVYRIVDPIGTVNGYLDGPPDVAASGVAWYDASAAALMKPGDSGTYSCAVPNDSAGLCTKLVGLVRAAHAAQSSKLGLGKDFGSTLEKSCDGPVVGPVKSALNSDPKVRVKRCKVAGMTVEWTASVVMIAGTSTGIQVSKATPIVGSVLVGRSSRMARDWLSTPDGLGADGGATLVPGVLVGISLQEFWPEGSTPPWWWVVELDGV